MKQHMFAQNLDSWMRKNGVTSQSLAGTLGCTVRSINRHRDGTRFPPWRVLDQYRNLMDVELDRLLYEQVHFDENAT